ncbi:hypothetical protein K8O93_06805 [Gordonia bronchialis]|uniref:hypothetical protein n=1 Tax=Gordonia bronchialis TaxID=2054 RepID=UPI001CBBD2D8|nr:hypothetical protein [Gordonia bronchialis]UAK39383.1 hypothetical protein K8O93_06805 [Gordonia bronchialis]
MRISLDVLGREVLAIEVVGADEEDADDFDTPLYELSAETERADIAEWRDDHDDAQLPAVIVARHHRATRRPRRQIVRIGTRHHQDPTPRAAAARQPVDGFGFTQNAKRRHSGAAVVRSLHENPPRRSDRSGLHRDYRDLCLLVRRHRPGNLIDRRS